MRGKSAIPLLDNGLVVIHQTLIEKDMEYRRADISVGPRGSYGPIKGTPGILKYRRTTGVSGSGGVGGGNVSFPGGVTAPEGGPLAKK